MDLTEEEKQILQAAVVQLWRKGCNSPQEAAVAQGLTKLTERLLKPTENK